MLATGNRSRKETGRLYVFRNSKPDCKRWPSFPYDIEVCRTFGELKAQLDLAGKSVSVSDLWIAACAKRHSLKLVTHNRKHFEKIPGLDIVSEAPGPSGRKSAS